MTDKELELIDKFFEKSLSKIEETEFADLMVADKSFAQQVSWELKFRHSLNVEPKIENMDEHTSMTIVAQPPKQHTFPFIYYAAAAVLIVGFCIFGYQIYNTYRERAIENTALLQKTLDEINLENAGSDDYRLYLKKDNLNFSKALELGTKEFTSNPSPELGWILGDLCLFHENNPKKALKFYEEANKDVTYRKKVETNYQLAIKRSQN